MIKSLFFFTMLLQFLFHLGVYALGIEVRSDEECRDSENLFNYISSETQTGNEIPEIFNSLSSACQSYLLLDPRFQREVEYFASLIENRIKHSPHQLRSTDLQGLENLLAINGKEVPEEYRNIFEARMTQTKTNCTNKDQRKKLNIPIRDQSSIGWCYAYAAADLVSFKSGKNISALDLAVTFNRMENYEAVRNTVSRSINFALLPGDRKNNIDWALKNLRNTFKNVESNSVRDGGQVDEAIKRAQMNGFCLESDQPSDAIENGSLGDALNVINTLIDDSNAFRSVTVGNREMSDIAAVSICENYGSLIGEMFPNTTVSDISDIFIAQFSEGALVQLRNLRCQNRVQIDGEIKEITGNKMDEIDQVLSSDNIVSVDYYIKALDLIGNDRQNSGLHASTIVGRKWNEQTNKCEYLIRNSWGESCAYYKNPEKCEDGYIWVDRDKIMANLHSARTFE